MATDKTATITARIPVDQKEEIERACKQNGISKSQYIKGLMNLQNEKASRTAERLRENPSALDEGGGGVLAAIGLTVGAVAILRYLSENVEVNNGSK